MKGFQIMFFSYLTMIGIPVLLFLAAVLSPFSSARVLREALEILIGLGAVVFGIVGVLEVYKR